MIKSNAVIFFISILLLTGCKQKEKIVIQEFKQPLEKRELEKIIFRDEAVIRTIKLSRIRMEVLMNDEEFVTNGTIGIIHDSIIIISLVPALGYEFARIYCTIDSLYIIDRQNKNMYSSRIDEQLRGINIKGDYYLLQGILMNKVVLFDRKEGDDVLYRNVLNEDDHYYYTIEKHIDKRITYKQTIIIRKENLLNEGMMVTDYLLNNKLNIRYDNFKDKKSFVFPMMIEITMMDKKDTLNIMLNIGDLEINEKINAVISLPKGYNKIRI